MMRNAAVLAGVLLLVPLSAAFCGPAPDGGEAQSTIRLESGEYLRDDYIQNLKNTLSPIKSTVFDTPQMAIVRSEGNSSEIILVFNFHEGGPVFTLEDELKIDYSTGLDLKHLEFNIINKNTFVLSESRFGKHTYENVGLAGVFVGNLLFAGAYSDSKGNKYSFGKGGQGFFAGKPMTYSAGTDYVVEQKFNYIGIAIEEKTAVYGFEIYPGKILLCETSGEFNETLNKDACLELTKK